MDFTFGEYPKRSARKTDQFAKALELLIKGIARQL